MKTQILTSIFFLCACTLASAQISLIAVGGVSPESARSSGGLLVNRHMPRDEFMLRLDRTAPQYFGGIKMHVPLSHPFFHELGILYTRRTHTFAVRYTYGEPLRAAASGFNEREDMLLLPATVGVRMGIVDVTSGLQGVISLSRESELRQIAGYAEEAAPVCLGWHAGCRLTIDRVALGMEYQSVLDRIGQGQSVNGQSLALRHVPGRFFFTIQYRW